jgi:hypothetical protein
MPSYDTPRMAQDTKASLSRNTITLNGHLNSASAATTDRQKRGQAVSLNSLGKGYFNVDQNNQSHFCKRVDEEVC